MLKSTLREAGSPGLAPLIDLLVSGGDERLHLDPASGQNQYGRTLIAPEGAVELGSCTMSALSPHALAAAERAHRELWRAEAAGRLPAVVEDACEIGRSKLLHCLDLAGLPGVQAVLTPSGTDAELVPLLIAASRHKGRICNIVVGPSEAGSGTTQAAGGHRPKQHTPLGARRPAGSAVSPALAARVHVETVAVRDDAGTLRDAGAVDADVEDLANAAARAGEAILVHRIAHSKTGVFAPSRACLARMEARHRGSLLVVVDAAQGRISGSELRRHLDGGDMVLFTGSKFYGGPPFSGAVIVPASTPAPEIEAMPGLFEYLSRCDLPPTWKGARARAPRHHNLGLLLRWVAALSEMSAYRAVPRATRAEIITAFGDSVRRRLGGSMLVTILPTPPIEDTLSPSDGEPQGSLPTVFSFSLRDERGRSLDLMELGRVARRLRPRFFLGQPVSLGSKETGAPAVLRVALGAPLVRSLATSDSRGAALSDRLRWLDEQIGALRSALEGGLS